MEDKKRRLAEYLVKAGILKSEKVLRAFLKVPREEFVPERYREYAYVDQPLPIGYGQTISAPHMCAMMCEALQLRPGHKVLEVGAGSGYHAALCAEMVSPTGEPLEGYVVSLELHPELARYAHENLKRTGYDDRVHVIACDGSAGPPVRSRFDKVLVTAAAPTIPPPLVEALADEGRMVIPVGPEYIQDLVLVVKRGGEVFRRSLGGCVFVALKGKYGFGLR